MLEVPFTYLGKVSYLGSFAKAKAAVLMSPVTFI